MSLTKTQIPYLTHAWPVVTGCSYGCPECWARRIANRFGKSFEPTFHPDRLGDPARKKKPAVIGVAFGGDLFDKNIEVEAVFEAAAKTPRHSYVFLTKRVEELHNCIVGWWKYTRLQSKPDNWYLGVTVRDQKELDAAAPHIRAMALAGWKVWLSIEPMQGPVWLGDLAELAREVGSGAIIHSGWKAPLACVILGGQSGPGAPPLHPEWVREVRDQCAAAGVPFMFKQWSDAQGATFFATNGMSTLEVDGWPVLDGRVHTELPWELATKALSS